MDGGSRDKKQNNFYSQKELGFRSQETALTSALVSNAPRRGSNEWSNSVSDDKIKKTISHSSKRPTTSYEETENIIQRNCSDIDFENDTKSEKMWKSRKTPKRQRSMKNYKDNNDKVNNINISTDSGNIKQDLNKIKQIHQPLMETKISEPVKVPCIAELDLYPCSIDDNDNIDDSSDGELDANKTGRHSKNHNKAKLASEQYWLNLCENENIEPTIIESDSSCEVSEIISELEPKVSRSIRKEKIRNTYKINSKSRKSETKSRRNRSNKREFRRNNSKVLQTSRSRKSKKYHKDDRSRKDKYENTNTEFLNDPNINNYDFKRTKSRRSESKYLSKDIKYSRRNSRYSRRHISQKPRRMNNSKLSEMKSKYRKSTRSKSKTYKVSEDNNSDRIININSKIDKKSNISDEGPYNMTEINFRSEDSFSNTKENKNSDQYPDKSHKYSNIDNIHISQNSEVSSVLPLISYYDYNEDSNNSNSLTSNRDFKELESKSSGSKNLLSVAKKPYISKMVNNRINSEENSKPPTATTCSLKLPEHDSVEDESTCYYRNVMSTSSNFIKYHDREAYPKSPDSHSLTKPMSVPNALPKTSWRTPAKNKSITLDPIKRESPKNGPIQFEPKPLFASDRADECVGMRTESRKETRVPRSQLKLPAMNSGTNDRGFATSIIGAERKDKLTPARTYITKELPPKRPFNVSSQGRSKHRERKTGPETRDPELRHRSHRRVDHKSRRHENDIVPSRDKKGSVCRRSRRRRSSRKSSRRRETYNWDHCGRGTPESPIDRAAWDQNYYGTPWCPWPMEYQIAWLNRGGYQMNPWQNAQTWSQWPTSQGSMPMPNYGDMSNNVASNINNMNLPGETQYMNSSAKKMSVNNHSLPNINNIVNSRQSSQPKQYKSVNDLRMNSSEPEIQNIHRSVKESESAFNVRAKKDLLSPQTPLGVPPPPPRFKGVIGTSSHELAPSNNYLGSLNNEKDISSRTNSSGVIGLKQLRNMCVPKSLDNIEPQQPVISQRCIKSLSQRSLATVRPDDTDTLPVNGGNATSSEIFEAQLNAALSANTKPSKPDEVLETVQKLLGSTDDDKPHLQKVIHVPNAKNLYESAALAAAQLDVAQVDLVACSECGRKFAADRIEAHKKACQKLKSRKAKPFNVAQHRVSQEAKEAIKKGTPVETKRNDQSWRIKSELFRKSLKQGSEMENVKTVTNEGYDNDLILLVGNKLTKCPHCNRSFGESQAERHIPQCAKICNRPKRLNRGSGTAGGKR